MKELNKSVAYICEIKYHVMEEIKNDLHSN